jgi:hypothetical protein
LGFVIGLSAIFPQNCGKIYHANDGSSDDPDLLARGQLQRQVFTGITRNGATPNYAFRVSAVDALVDVRLLAYAHKKFAAKKAGLMLRKTRNSVPRQQRQRVTICGPTGRLVSYEMALCYQERNRHAA